MPEATPTNENIQHSIPDGTAEQQREDGDNPNPHHVQDVQAILRARCEAHPFKPVRKTQVWRMKTAGRRVIELSIKLISIVLSNYELPLVICQRAT